MSPSFDERLQAIAESLELMLGEQREQQHRQEELRRRQDELDRRERQGRRALMVAMQAYLEALNGDGEES